MIDEHTDQNLVFAATLSSRTENETAEEVIQDHQSADEPNLDNSASPEHDVSSNGHEVADITHQVHDITTKDDDEQNGEIEEEQTNNNHSFDDAVTADETQDNLDISHNYENTNEEGEVTESHDDYNEISDVTQENDDPNEDAVTQSYGDEAYVDDNNQGYGDEQNQAVDDVAPVVDDISNLDTSKEATSAPDVVEEAAEYEQSGSLDDFYANLG